MGGLGLNLANSAGQLRAQKVKRPMIQDITKVTKYNFKIENPRVSQWFQKLYVQPLVVKEVLFSKPVYINCAHCVTAAAQCEESAVKTKGN